MPLIEGLEALKPSDIHVHKGALELPENFDRNKFVGKWAKQGSEVNQAKRAEIIPGAGVRAAGWEVWKDPKKGSLCKRTLGKGVYILLVRPRPLQEAVNKLHGNASRMRMMREAQGNTVAGEERTDTGLLPSSVLEQIPGLGREEAEPLQVPLNELHSDDTRRPVSARATRKPKTR